MRKILRFLFICIAPAIGFTNAFAKNTRANSILQEDTTTARKIFGKRISVIGDFNGDGKTDTVFESYISKLTGKETYRLLDSGDWDNNIELIANNQPVSRIYTTIPGVDTFIIADASQLNGLMVLENLGDINGDGKDEIGYVIAWADYSNINTYHIITLAKKKFKEIFSFGINERINFDPDELFKNGGVVQRAGKKIIHYKYWNNEAEVATGTHIFK